MFNVIILGIIKVLDNIITTAKSITTYQNDAPTMLKHRGFW